MDTNAPRETLRASDESQEQKEQNAPCGLLRAFTQLKDPRMNRTKHHPLENILVISICAVICGADGPTDIAEFGRYKEDWFKTFLTMPKGIPSHDTFGRVLEKLDPLAFEQCFVAWINDLAVATEGRLIAIDGKTLRGSLDQASGKSAIHMVSAWCQANHMVLGQLATDDKSNEITAIPELLKLLDIKGAVVTIDAMGCQKEIAAQIVGDGGDYLLHLKGNHEYLLLCLFPLVIRIFISPKPITDCITCQTIHMPHICWLHRTAQHLTLTFRFR